MISGNGVRVQGLVINGFDGAPDSAGIALVNPAPTASFDLYQQLG